jgi:hypothetical protein
VYLDWRPSPFHIETFLPAFFDAKAILGDRLEIGLRAEVSGNAYAVRDARVAKVWPCAPNPVDDPTTSQNELVPQRRECFDHVAYSVVTAGAMVSVRLFGSVWMSAFGGRSLFRRFELMNDDNDRITGGAQDLPNAFFVRSRLAWRIPMH